MGFFSSITKPFTQVVKSVTQIVKNPVKAVTSGTLLNTALTGGLNLAVPKLNTTLSKATQVLTNPKVALPVALGVLTRQPALAVSGFTTAIQPQGVQPMAINIGGLLGQVGQIFGGNQNPAFQTISGISNIASQFFPQPTANLPAAPRNAVTALPTMAMAPMIRGGAMVARGFFNKFPNLALAIQQLRARGITVKRSQLWSMLKRFGPEVLITGGILTAAGVSELMVAGPGHRRMNPANVKALRRSMRRLDSFHRLCVSADKLRRPRSRSRSGSKALSTQFVRQG